MLAGHSEQLPIKAKLLCGSRILSNNHCTNDIRDFLSSNSPLKVGDHWSNVDLGAVISQP
jgi:hypothetical protein